MDRTLVEFVKVLRTAELKVSPAETLDAMQCMDLVGYEDKVFLKNSLSMVLAKTPEEKETFDSCFDSFFSIEEFKPTQNEQDSPDADSDAFDDEGEFNPDANNQQSGKGGGQGGGGQGGGEHEDLSSESTMQATSELGKLLTEGTKTEQMIAMMEAGREVEVNQIVVFTQKGLFTRKIMDAMGLKGLQEEVAELQGHGGIPQKRLAHNLKKVRDLLRERVRDYVEKQFFLHADESGKQLREELLKKVKLSNLEKRNFKDVQEVVFKMAKKLIAIHSKRRKTYKRGQLDVRKTLRHNMQYDGMFFDIKWKSKKVDRPKVMCICDVSGSVSNYSRFLLMFLFSLAEILPKVRSFAFSSDLGEVTKLFEHSNLEEAMARTMRDYGNGSTDYGRMFQDFKSHCMDDVNNKTTIIILGDARNNYGEPHAEILREMYDKSKRVIWLNPEPKSSWTVGDAEMKKYAPCCHQTEVCNSLVHLERVVGNLLKSVG
ncbi:MAG TPA: VWA domain-containing protein [Gammaproteobacteria bacterium]|nr:VWA domain-containing protein [Gammaproteobacteria bacterium]HIL94950.1 VWA domain-containing protein [Pseudomonadales bacterium]